MLTTEQQNEILNQAQYYLFTTLQLHAKANIKRVRINRDWENIDAGETKDFYLKCLSTTLRWLVAEGFLSLDVDNETYLLISDQDLMAQVNLL